jgi:hypothetical protein
MATQTDMIDRTAQVRHPLETVRRLIRRYVILESLAIVILGVALWFWIGLLLDFGLFRAAAFDWMLELDFLDPSGQGSFWVRALVAIAVLGLLGYLLVSRLALRMMREFSDAAVAVVLERRFPRQLGDRLITAVELADPKKAESYGFSGDMLRQTIREAAERVEQVPVAEVFDWARLRRLWLFAGGATLGLLVVALAGWLVVQSASGGIASPFHALYGMRDVGAIWTERNVFLQTSYWPRSNHLEVVRFQSSKEDRDEMRIGQNAARPDLVVRGVEWVVPDKRGVTGWRALEIGDIGNFVPLELVKNIGIPERWSGWTVDLDDLPAEVPTGAIPGTLQGKTIGELDDELKGRDLKADGLDKAVAALGDWRTWTFDKLLLQINKPDVADRLAKQYPAARAAIDELEQRLKAVAADPAMGRQFRQLETPANVQVFFRGETTQTKDQINSQVDRKFTIALGEIKESVTFFVRGGDFFTRPLRIKLVPPPSVDRLELDKEEPAYLYWRIPGDQGPLKGLRQIFKGHKAAVGGDRTAIDVPLGADLKLHARVNRKLKEGIAIRPVGQTREAGVVVPIDAAVVRDADGKGFSVAFKNVVRTMDFQFEFNDLDNVQGIRKIRIRPVDDQPPDIANFELVPQLRKGKWKEGLARSLAGGAADGFLITPKANLPMSGTVKDDVELTKLVWAFETQPITIEKATGTEPGRVTLQGNPTIRRTGLIASLFQFGPMGQGQLLAAAPYLGMVSRVIEADLKQKQADPERFAPLASFAMQLQRVEETPLEKLGELLQKLPKERFRLKEHVLKDHESFNVREHLPDIRVTEVGSPKEVFHVLKLSIAATDNNVETGPSTSRNRAPIQFLIVSESELLAQVGFEEEVLHDRFEKVVAKLKVAQTTLKAQVATLKAAMPETDYSLAVLRIDEVRKALLDTAAATREMHVDYSRILTELQVNNVRADKISDLQNKIVLPLELVLRPDFGSFFLADDAVQRLYVNLDDDVNAKKVGKNIAAHQKSATEAAETLDVLIERMQSILASIDQGVDFSKILTLANDLERRHRDAIPPLVKYQDDLIGSIFDFLRDPQPNKK